MDSKRIFLSAVKLNAANPRTISDAKFQKLINSILSLPQMLDIRPVVVDGDCRALGGNMRLRALCEIAKMGSGEIDRRLAASRDVQKKNDEEKSRLRSYWLEWLQQPTVPVVDAAGLSAAEQNEFIIKDNGDFGTWDYDMLANQWNADDLCDWGVDVWQNKEVENVYANGGSALSPETASILAQEVPTAAPTDFSDALPPELQGVDLTPEDLPKIEGSDETAMERVIIVYPKDRKTDVEKLLGIAITKIVIAISEILGDDESDN